MSIRGGVLQIEAGEVTLRGLQSGGVDNANIPETKIQELGSELSVATVYDTPDVSWPGETLDFSMDLEAILTRVDPASVTSGQEFSFLDNKPIDMVSPWKGKYGGGVSVNGVIAPYLLLERITYRGGVRANASKQFTLRGDSIYYTQVTPWFKRFAAATVASLGAGPYTFDHTAIKTVESGADVYAYCVTLHHTDGTWDRLRHGDDYTDTNAGFTLLAVPAATDTIDVVYASSTTRALAQQVNTDLDTYPAALRGKDVEVWISDGAATPTSFIWKGVQTAEATWSVTLDADEELGNPHYVARDYDTPDVSGTISVRPANGAALMTAIRNLQQVSSTTQTLNTLGFQPMELEIRFNHPDTGARLETVYVPDARFTPPGTPGRVGQKNDFSLAYKSDSGTLLAYKGERP